jgi:hypothetical protein
MDNLYKLSPSDFKYLWEDCKHCFWHKVHNKEYQPGPFPSIFNKMSGMLQEEIIDSNISDLVDGIPQGKAIEEEGFIKSQPFPSGESFISGRFDLLVEFNDGTYGVVDLKMVDPKEPDLDKFSRQLHAYKYALEKPKDREPVEVSKIGLLILEPVDVSVEDGDACYRAEQTWREFEIDMDSFFDFIEEVEGVLNGGEPDPESACDFCVYRYDL